MPDKTPSSLIINSPYEKPIRYWEQDENGKLLTVTQGRRPAAYELYDTRTNTRRVEKLELVNAIRERVDAWRDAGWPGVTSVPGNYWNIGVSVANGTARENAGLAGHGNILFTFVSWKRSNR